MQVFSSPAPRRGGYPVAIASVATIILAVMLASARAALAAPEWRIASLANTTVAPGETLDYNLDIANQGDVGTDGATPITLTATLGAGLTFASESDSFGAWSCAGTTSVSCTYTGEALAPLARTTPTFTVSVDPGASGLSTSSFVVRGGDPSEPSASTVDPTIVTPAAPTFGVDAFDGQVTADASGTPFTQAGGHPYATTTSIDFNTFTTPHAQFGIPSLGELWPVEPTKDVSVDLPPGFIGNPTAAARCSASDLANAFGLEPFPNCSPASQVGTTIVRLNDIGVHSVFGPLPVFNVVPPPGVPARFGFNILGTVVTLDGQPRSGGDYGLTVSVRNTPQVLPIAGTSLTFWGVPADSSHDRERACRGSEAPWEGGPTCTTDAEHVAFLRNPTSCSAPGVGLLTSLHIDSWVHPASFNADGSPDLNDPLWQTASFTTHNPPEYPAPPGDRGAEQGPTGCEKVPFDPTLATRPGSPARAGQPDGFDFDLRLPQNDDPTAIGEADLKRAVVTLPEGVRVNPSSADGLQGCSQDQFALKSSIEPICPDASKLGTVVVDSPLLDTPLTGSVYLARPFANPFGSLLAVYLAFNAEGVMIKVPGEVHADPSTGQLTATFDNNPQLPFTRVHMVLDGGPRAPLTMPSTCGPHTTNAVLTGWNGKVVNTTSTFTVSGDGHGSTCPSPQFAPGFTAGTQNPVAGGFSPFSLQLTRTDNDGEFSSLSSLSLPPGLLANVASITTRCTIEQADAHACPAASHIGEVTAGAGAGSDPFYVPGDVYLTGPYEGNPFGIAVIVHAQAGPFDLGYVVVKGAIQIHDDGSVTVATDPFPTILQGIPLQVKDIRVNLDRPGFTFNPTSCNPMSINGTVQSTENQVAGVSSRFQVGECANHAFKPKFSASTAGKTSKANGASFHVHLASNEGPHGTGGASESNIAKVDVQLPVSLPARLTTLQKACTAAQFASNPAGCPAASFVGSATAHTPILASPLSGPAILVSHGGQAFPDLVLVLQGEGVRLNLTGHTQIKKGITSSHFETVPDAPVASFDLTLPQGPHSALTTDIPGRNLCANTKTVTVTKRITRRVNGHTRRVTVKAKKAVSASLLMPTTITAQNGAVVHQNTKIAVTGCGRAKTVKHKTKKRK
jgi:uncharacterized repeat protein (TIGR01451 family)